MLRNAGTRRDRIRAYDVAAPQTRSLVFGSILSGGLVSRTHVARQTGLSPSTVTKAVTPLLEAEYVVEQGDVRNQSGAGRPQRMLAVNRDRHSVIGLKLHPQHVTGVRTDLTAQVTAEATQPLTGHRIEHVLAAATDVVRELVPRASDPLGLGVAIGGHVDSTSGIVVHSGVLGWSFVDLAGALRRATGLPTVVNNDLNALAVAARWLGKGRDAESFAVVSIGAGIGSGIVLRGSLFTGATGLAGELGHVPLVADGPRCGCGNRGCVESIASTGAILAAIEQRGGPRCESLEQAAALARASDGEPARAAFEVAGTVLGMALATLCNLLNLELVILSGEGVVAYDAMAPALHRALRAHAFSTAATDCEVVVDAVDDSVWARGAASLVIHDALLRDGA